MRQRRSGCFQGGVQEKKVQPTWWALPDQLERYERIGKKCERIGGGEQLKREVERTSEGGGGEGEYLKQALIDNNENGNYYYSTLGGNKDSFCQ